MMKKTLGKISIVAAMVFGAVTAAQADVTVNVQGSVAATTCDIQSNMDNQTINLGTHARTDLSSTGDEVGSQPFILTFGSCTGEDLPEGEHMKLQVTGESLNDSGGSNLWGDKNGLGWGVVLKDQGNNSTIDAVGGVAQYDLGAEGDSGGTKAEDIELTPLNMSVALKSYSSTIKSGTQKTSLVFTAMYN
ncbi:fimbrial protein [Citrobacter koseri]|uniref:fimbrial protein n=1 Tax=Citrobacter koseri TaxID=545 RepID=UPI001F1AADA8|nr:fimbrial protein [Citrobacter koseri]